MAKLSENILRIIAAAGVKLTESQTAVLAELPQDDVSPSVQSLFDDAANAATSEIAKISTKAANLDKFDDGLSGWSDLLGEDIKATAKEKGLQKLDKIKSMIASKIEEAKRAAANGDAADVTALRSKIAELEQQAAKLVTEKDKAIGDVKAEYQTKMFNAKMITKLQSRKDILDAYNNEDALQMLILPKVMEYVNGKGLKIRTEQLDVVKADTETPYLKGAKPATLDDIIEEAISEKGYRQNSGVVPPTSTVSVEGDSTIKSTRANALRPERRL